MFNFFRNKFKNILNPTKIGDIDFKKKFRKLTNKELKEDAFRKKILNAVFLQSINKDFHKIKKINNSSSRFNEFLDRLLIRYSEIREVEWELYHRDNLKEKRSLNDIQTDFVNRTESFHQEIYSCLGAFIKLLTNLNDGKSNKFLKNLPFAETTNFLNYINKEIPSLNNTVDKIKKSTIEYRSKFIDHINQSPDHDWYTFQNFDSKLYVIYYTKKDKGELLFISELSSEKLKIHTPFFAESYFIPPHHKNTIESFIYLISEIFSHINN